MVAITIHESSVQLWLSDETRIKLYENITSEITYHTYHKKGCQYLVFKIVSLPHERLNVQTYAMSLASV